MSTKKDLADLENNALFNFPKNMPGFDNIQERFPVVIFLTVKEMMKKMNEVFEKNQIPITVEQFPMLMLIKHATKQFSQQELASILERDKSAVVRALDSLEKRGFVKRQEKEGDRRVNLVSLTKSGNLIIEEAMIIEEKCLKQLQSGFDEKDFEAFNRILKQIRETNFL